MLEIFFYFILVLNIYLNKIIKISKVIQYIDANVTVNFWKAQDIEKRQIFSVYIY